LEQRTVIAIQRRWVVLGMAGLIASMLPILFLWPDDTRIGMASLPPSTTLTMPQPMPVAAALSAPVFTPGRLPPDLTAPTEAPSPPATQPASQSNPPILVGVAMRVRGTGVALVRAADGQTSMIKPGDVVDGWTLALVSASQAVFKRGDDRQTASLDFSNKQAVAATASSSMSAPAQEPPAASPSNGQ
jgi:hypothetical protein